MRSHLPFSQHQILGAPRDQPMDGPMAWAMLGVCILLCLGVAALGGVFVASSIDGWYAELQKPVFNPPNWLFAPVWTALYVMMGVALFRVWRRMAARQARFAYIMFGVQLFLNLLWTVLFFGLTSPAIAFFEILLLVVAIRITQLAFLSIDRIAGWLMVPYLLWVTFATALNAMIWYLNPG